tara:strand:- start:1194 stop:1718 length:525 start_codon:yes stop_codon:yes gene_type:complete
MTSNVGVSTIRRQDAVGFRPSLNGGMDGEMDEQNYVEMRIGLLNQLRKAFRPEFINRIDEIVVFRSLTRSQVKQIVGIQIDDLRCRITEQGINLEVTDAALELLLDAGWDAEYGARPMRRAIQREVENPIAKMVLESKCPTGCTVTVGADDGRIKLDVQPAFDGEAQPAKIGDG